MASIVVSGSLLRRPSAQSLALHVQYLLGLRKLGHQVLYLEEHHAEPRPQGADDRLRPPLPLARLREVLRRSRVSVPVTWVDPDAGLVGGSGWPHLRRYMASADLLLELGGPLRLAERSLPRRRALVESGWCDRGTSQSSSYEHRFALGAGGLSSGYEPTLPPIVSRLWYGPHPRRDMPIEAIAQLPEHGAGREDFGVRFLLELPSRSEAPMQIGWSDRNGGALREQLVSAGWRMRDDGAAAEVSLRAARREAIGVQSALCLLQPSGGGAEQLASSIVRGAHLLGAGRPLVVWDPAGLGGLPASPATLTVEGLQDAELALRRIGRSLSAYSGAARDLAGRFLDYRVVLPALLARALPRHLSAVA